MRRSFSWMATAIGFPTSPETARWYGSRSSVTTFRWVWSRGVARHPFPVHHCDAHLGRCCGRSSSSRLLHLKSRDRQIVSTHQRADSRQARRHAPQGVAVEQAVGMDGW